MEVEVSDKLIAVTTMLFILSMISERIITFIKLWCVKGRSFLFVVVSDDVDTSIKATNPVDEAKRSRSILAINLTVSFLIALMSKASLFDMFSFSDTHPEIWNNLFSWQNETFSFSFKSVARLLSIIFGCVLTGSFISLGSKFWHDLLDLLLQVKNLKSKLNDKETYDIQNIQSLEQYVNTDYNELARICIEQNKTKIESLSNIESCFVGLSSDPSNRKPVIILYSSLNQGGNYPKSYKATLSTGKMFTVSVEVIYGFDIPEIHLGIGDSICNTNTANIMGTICCGVQKGNKKYLLTCAHVLTGGSVKMQKTDAKGWIVNPYDENVTSEDFDFKPIGTWCFGLINSEIDLALVETELDIEPIANNKAYPADYNYDLNHEEIFVNGNKNKKRGYIIGYSEETLQFKYGIYTHSIGKLILLSTNKSDNPLPLTQPGDSGAIVYTTKDRTPIGMILGGNKQYTYAIPITSLLQATQTKLI